MTEEVLIKRLNSKNRRNLFEEADSVRRLYCGEEVHLRGLIEFSNYCSRNCLYCGLRRDNRKIVRYRMSFEEIFQSARFAVSKGIRTLVLQSGEEDGRSIKELCDIIEKIKKELGCAVTLSVGEKSPGEYLALKKAGTDRYLLKFETSDEKLFKKMKPDSSYSARLGCIDTLAQFGFQTGSGNIVGLPGQTPDIIAGDIQLMTDLALDMISVTPFIPHPDTPLAMDPQGKMVLTLKTLALTRISALDAHMPATTAMRTIHSKGYEKALKCGANVIMPNFTPGKYKKHYSIYPGKICIKEDVEKSLEEIVSMLGDIGRTVASGYGHSLKGARFC